ncbi:TPA: DNA-directed RNA polymerase subunit L [Candidatus Bathyarchaeota archaeon]|nr:DNA-directed RNA polymerase subunit L [Candidatus Bathyarchaeota archaeon]
MKVEFIRKEKSEWEIKISGEDHTLLNLIQDELLKDPNVDFAAYTRPHPLVSHSVIYVRTKDETKTSFLSALERILNITTEFEEVFKKAYEQKQKV